MIFARHHLAVLAVIGAAALSTGLGVALSNADEPKAPDLSDLRDAVTAAARRGNNVDEIRKAVDALQKSLASGWTAPPAGKTVEPSPELVALRETVEAAAKKGENVEEIRAQLDLVEKAMTGKVQTKPKPQPLPDPIAPVDPLPPPLKPRPNMPLRPQIIPGNGVDQEAIQKAQEMMRKAAELMLRNGAEDPDARKLMQEARDLMFQAMLGGRRQPIPQILIPEIAPAREKFRLGVRLERVSELAADQLGLEVGRGVGIVDVVEGSAAQKAGFKPFDIVLEFAGKPVTENPEDFTRLVASVKGGDKLDAVVMRKGKKVEIKGIVLPDVAQANPRDIQDDLLPLLPEFNKPAPGRPGGKIEPGQGNSTFYSNNNGQVQIKATQNGVKYEIFGEQQKGGAIEPSRIMVVDGDKKFDVEKVDKLPENYRPVVEDLLNNKGTKRKVPPRDRE